MIIGFHGLKGSGKSTAADYLILKYGFREVSFAQPMKASMAAFLDVDPAHLEAVKNSPIAKISVFLPAVEDEFEPFKIEHTVRQGYQRYGTEAHRLIPEFGMNVWTDMAESKFDGLDNCVVADCRFVNEAETVRACGGYVLHIIRDDVVVGDTHASEGLLPPENIDSELDNNGRIEDLYDRLDLLIHGKFTLGGAS
jgi:hypothetical protein